MQKSNHPGSRERRKEFMIMKKIIALTLSVVLLALCFAGCTAKKNGKKETIVVGYTIYAPMNYLDDNGELVGFDTDLAKAVFENLGYNVIFQEIEWSSKYTDLNSGTIDCVWNGFTCNVADDDDGILFESELVALPDPFAQLEAEGGELHLLTAEEPLQVPAEEVRVDGVDVL